MNTVLCSVTMAAICAVARVGGRRQKAPVLVFFEVGEFASVSAPDFPGPEHSGGGLLHDIFKIVPNDVCFL